MGGDAEAPFPLTETDRWVLSQTDQEFKKHDWQDLKQIIGSCRPPTQLSTAQYSTQASLPFSWPAFARK